MLFKASTHRISSRKVAFIGALFLVLLSFASYKNSYSFSQWSNFKSTASHASVPDLAPAPAGDSEFLNNDKPAEPAAPPKIEDDNEYSVDWSRHREVFSLSTEDRKYFKIRWETLQSDDSIEAYNVNIIPHPTEHDQWIIAAQRQQHYFDFMSNPQVMTCSANFVDGALVCKDPPTALPIARTPGCEGDGYPGAHDPRIFYGPDIAYLLYGSHSHFSCHGMWIHDLRMMLHQFNTSDSTAELFINPTDIQRPPPYGDVEKNYFIFWDDRKTMHVHQGLAPGRTFTQLALDGSAGPDLAPHVADIDDTCMSKYMPKLGVHELIGEGIKYESIHQSTNSLSVTLCKRSDPTCVPTKDNTFIMFIFHHKTYNNNHAAYYPYVMLFAETSPFAIHAISQKSIWIHGRAALSRASDSAHWRGREDEIPKGHSEMFFFTSLSWKRHGQKYHGFIDDEVFLGFGIEDSRSAGMDVLMGDLLQDLAYCSDDTALRQ